MSEIDNLKIDPKALYTVGQAAKMLMLLDEHLSYEEAHRRICAAIDGGKLPVAGYLQEDTTASP